MPNQRHAPQVLSAAEAAAHIQSRDRVFLHGGAALPRALTDALVGRAAELRDVRLYHVHTEGAAPWAAPELADSFEDYSFFIGENVRAAVGAGRADYIPMMLSQIPACFRERMIPLDVALVSVSAPDKEGFVSLGTSVDVALAAVQSARIVIAQQNSRLPRTGGDARIPLSDIDFIVPHDEPLPVISARAPTALEQAIACQVAALVPDGATLQMGIGALPNAVLAELMGHKDLGVHTEMFSDGLIPLLEKGVVNNRCKKLLPGRTVSSFLVGSQRLYDFVHDNPDILMNDIGWVNDPGVIAQNPAVMAINSAIEIDLSGQVCADSIGHRLYSGVGGQLDFMLGSARSAGGRPIIALASRTAKGASKLVATLQAGAGVVSTRAHVHWVVTEYGAVDLFGKGLQERARLLISIAHPDDREDLERAARALFNGTPRLWDTAGKPPTT